MRGSVFKQEVRMDNLRMYSGLFSGGSFYSKYVITESGNRMPMSAYLLEDLLHKA